MKLISEKGKLFGIINVVDLICLLIILLAAAAFGWKILGSQVQSAVAPTVEMTTTLRIRGAQDYLQKEVERFDLVGEQLVAGTGYVADAFITDVWTEPYITQAVTDEGVIVDAEDPTKVDIMVTVVSKIASGTPILKIGTQEVRAGRTYTLKTRTFEVNAQVESVVVDD